MSAQIYVDTNIFLDWWLDRSDSMRPIGEFAFRLFQDAISCKFTVLISRYVILELVDVLGVPESQVWIDILDPLCNARKLSVIDVSPAQKAEAETIANLRGLPYTDVLYAILARDNKAVLVTRDRHYDEIGICQTAKPENLP